MEVQKYLGEGFLYFTPGNKQELHEDNDNLVANFVSANSKFAVENDDKKDTYFTLTTGTDFALSEATSVNLNFGLKANGEDQYYNGNFGVKFKF